MDKEKASLNSKISFKVLSDSSVNKNKAICRCELSYHQSTSSSPSFEVLLENVLDSIRLNEQQIQKTACSQRLPLQKAACFL